MKNKLKHSKKMLKAGKAILAFSFLSYFMVFSCSEETPEMRSNSSGTKLKSSPITIQAESYVYMSGIQLEDCEDENSGQNVGYIDQDDWMVYDVNIPYPGSYTVKCRVASLEGGGVLQLEKAGGEIVYGTINIPSTNGWQNWTTISHQVELVDGSQQIGIKALVGGWNINWLEISFNTDNDDQDPVVWQKANLTNYTSYPDPGSDECLYYNGCEWAGYFAFVDGKQPESWVMSHNIASVHSRDADQYALKTLRLRQGSRQIDVVVYDMCSDTDCDGCCTQNADAGGIGFLIDIEKYTMERFGSGDGIVEWRCLDCDE